MTFLPTSRLAATVVALSLLTTILPAEESRLSFYRGNLRADKSENWRTRLWAIPYGNWNRLQSEEDTAGFRTDTFAVMAGFDRRRNSRFYWSWSGGGSWVSVSGDQGTVDKEIDTFKTMLRGTVEAKDWRFSLGGGYGHSAQDTERRSFSSWFRGHNRADQWGFRSDFCLKVGVGLFEMEPFLAAECYTFSESGYSENRIGGTGSTKSFGKQTEDSFATSIGVRYRWRQTGYLAVWRPELSAAWRHEFGSDKLFYSSPSDPFPTLYTFPDARIRRDHLLVGVGLTGNLGSTMDIFAQYTTAIAGNYTSHNILCGTNWKF